MVSAFIVLSWLAVMAILVNRSYLHASPNLATDLARYGSSAQWRGVYYRGEKIGFTVSQTVPVEDGFELQEHGQLQMSLLGAHTFTTLQTSARVNRSFELQSFRFALDPGTGPITISGEVQKGGLRVAITTAGRTRHETVQLAEPPLLSLNLTRRLAAAGLQSGARYEWRVFDPATLRNAPVTLHVKDREIVRSASVPTPAFRVEMELSGLRTTSWITDTGDVIREESPLGFMTVRETPERARALAVPGQVRQDLLKAAAVVPDIAPGVSAIAEGRDVRRLRMRVIGADLKSPDIAGVGQRVDGDTVEIVDMQDLRPEAGDPNVVQYLQPEAFIESDDPEIVRAAGEAVDGVIGARARAEALTRYVNATVQKKPTVSLPSAREVLRTRIGDCNEHTVLLVALARAAKVPARIAVGLAYVRGAFYYHAWAEVYIEERRNRGYWLPVDPTFNQVPADSTHFRLARGGLDKQAAIIPLIGQVRITLLDVELLPGSAPILVGQDPTAAAVALAPRSAPRVRWCLPCFLGGGE